MTLPSPFYIHNSHKYQWLLESNPAQPSLDPSPTHAKGACNHVQPKIMHQFCHKHLLMGIPAQPGHHLSSPTGLFPAIVLACANRDCCSTGVSSHIPLQILPPHMIHSCVYLLHGSASQNLFPFFDMFWWNLYCSPSNRVALSVEVPEKSFFT